MSTDSPIVYLPARWNWPHLAMLAALPAYAAWAQAQGWSAQVTLTAGTLLALLALMLAERWNPHRPDWAPRRADLQRDAAFLSINALADAFGSWLVHVAALAWLAWAPFGSGPARDWSPWLAVPLAIALGELGPYWLHRRAHAGGWLWRVHAVHHTPDKLNASNNLTTHPLNVLWNRLARVAPWLLLGFDAQAALWAALFLQLQSFATHANTAGGIGALNYLIGSTELHRWHHSVVMQEAKNFSTAIPLWDQLFGTWYLPPRHDGPRAVGLADAGPAAGSWCALLCGPLQRTR